MKTPVVMSWSGGKHSAVALHELRMSGEYEVVALMSSISAKYHRIGHHEMREGGSGAAGRGD
jgi:diphthamide synthase (EF-2-diphthine--ammonia ligase)